MQPLCLVTLCLDPCLAKKWDPARVVGSLFLNMAETVCVSFSEKSAVRIYSGDRLSGYGPDRASCRSVCPVQVVCSVLHGNPAKILSLRHSPLSRAHRLAENVGKRARRRTWGNRIQTSDERRIRMLAQQLKR
ncbi:hypothetical protein BD414DRAFT_230104 [Trametes punicea]|nr:hypothetical protein BD414DRAFT_230104 [Trametes punicea]